MPSVWLIINLSIRKPILPRRVVGNNKVAMYTYLLSVPSTLAKCQPQRTFLRYTRRFDRTD
jgi:hypothetical protein